MKIEVTQEDIKKGKRLDPTSCPIALAVKRLTHKSVCVRQETMWIDKCFYILPIGAAQFFDHSDPVKPFTFTIILWE